MLERYGILDTPPDERFDRIVDLATHLFDAPTGLVTFVDDEREWAKARHRFPYQELPISESFGASVVESGTRVAVENALEDPRFATNPLVTDAPGIRFYAGAPLRTADDVCIGTVAVMDTTRQSPPPAALKQLDTLAALVVDLLEEKSQFPDNEDLIDALLSSSSANAVVLDENGVILRTNKSWETFAEENDLDDPSTVGKGTNYLHALAPSRDVPDDPTTQRAREGLDEVLRGEKDTFDLVYPCHSPEEKRWFEMRVRRLDHPGAQAIVSHRNVTDRQWKRRQRRILETAVEHAREAVVITASASPDEPDPPITYVNPAFTDMTGYESHDVIGKSPDILQGPDTEKWVLREMEKEMQRGNPFEGDALNYRKDGTPFVNHWSIAPVRDDEGRITHWVSLQRDVTEERQMERRLLEAQERERRRIAEEMHHEMGGLLTSLQMTISYARSEGDGGSALKRIETHADSLSEVVRTLTERLHSRIIDDYGLSDALVRMALDFEQRYGLSVEVHNEIPDDERLPPLVEKISYRGLFEALKNVVEHAETDHAQLLVNVDSRTLRLHVIDEGIGFEPSRDLADDQYGLLAIKKRVDRMNGRLEVASTPGEGTRISVTLPLSFDPSTET